MYIYIYIYITQHTYEKASLFSPGPEYRPVDAGKSGAAVAHVLKRTKAGVFFLYEEFARLAETRLAQNTSNYLNTA